MPCIPPGIPVSGNRFPPKTASGPLTADPNADIHRVVHPGAEVPPIP